MITFPAKAYKKHPDSIKSPFRYCGGKFYALKEIMPFIESVPHDEYREPFVGGGSVFFAKKKSKYSILNDSETDLINTYRIIRDNSEALCDMIKNETADKSRYEEIKNYIPRTPLESAYRTYYLNRTSYSGIINKPAWGYAKGKSSPPPNWPTFIRDASVKLQRTEIYCEDFETILSMEPKGKNVLMYLDPPYYNADQKRAYIKPFEKEDHLRLEQELRNTDFFFCLSYDDCREVRELYSWAKQYKVSWLYNTANCSGTERKAGNELIITNYNVDFNQPCLQTDLTSFCQSCIHIDSCN